MHHPVLISRHVHSRTYCYKTLSSNAHLLTDSQYLLNQVSFTLNKHEFTLSFRSLSILGCQWRIWIWVDRNYIWLSWNLSDINFEVSPEPIHDFISLKGRVVSYHIQINITSVTQYVVFSDDHLGSHLVLNHDDSSFVELESCVSYACCGILNDSVARRHE